MVTCDMVVSGEGLHLFIGRFLRCIEESNLRYTGWCMIREREGQGIVPED